MELRLYIDAERPLSFVAVGTNPASAPNSLAWLDEVGDLTLVARTSTIRGTFSDQNASLVVRLVNRDRQASKLIGQPLRKQAIVYDDDGSEYFAGLVGPMEYEGDKLAITIEA